MVQRKSKIKLLFMSEELKEVVEEHQSTPAINEW